MSSLVDWLNIIAIVILASVAISISVLFILLWSPFLLLGMALDYYEQRKTF